MTSDSPGRPIGIFDSGIGGLTVLRSIAQALPSEDLIYLGDTARVPYGTKSPLTVTRYSRHNIRFLLERDVKLVVVACNTASAYALPALRQELKLPVVGVIEPGVEGALAATRNRKIGVIGTEGTIESQVYPKEIQKREPKALVWSQACPLFVPLVEEGILEGELPEAAARRYLEGLFNRQIDTLILGCTHYPLLKSVIRKVAGNVSLIDSADEMAREVGRLLGSRRLLNPQTGTSRLSFFVTDHPARFQRVAALFLGRPLDDVTQVDV